MEQRRIYEKNGKKWPFVFNGIVIFCLILLILGMRWQAKKEESEVLNVTESLQKESEITSFSEEEEAVLYMLSALKKNDLVWHLEDVQLMRQLCRSIL